MAGGRGAEGGRTYNVLVTFKDFSQIFLAFKKPAQYNIDANSQVLVYNMSISGIYAYLSAIPDRTGNVKIDRRKKE